MIRIDFEIPLPKTPRAIDIVITKNGLDWGLVDNA